METATTTTPAGRGWRTGRRILRTIVVLIFLVIAGFVIWKYFFTYSSGNRYGLLQKFSHKGNIFKTYEGEMILSSVRGTTEMPVASEKFYFSVTQKNVADKLMTLQGKYITVHYKEKNGTLPWRGDSRYIVDSVVNAQ